LQIANAQFGFIRDHPGIFFEAKGRFFPNVNLPNKPWHPAAN
jgi:hypothetical protein